MVSGSFQLVMRSGPTPGQVFELIGETISIGRDTASSIAIADSEVSRKHARLRIQDRGYLIEDLGSTNGTFVNGQRLMGPHLLKHGELIKLADNISLVYEEISPDLAATMISDPSLAAAAPPRIAPAQPEPYQRQGPAPSAEPYIPPKPVYQEPVLAAPQAAYMPPPAPYPYDVEEESRSKTWYYVGCGCLVVMLCLTTASLFIVDSLNLWCVGSLEGFWNSIGFVCQ